MEGIVIKSTGRDHTVLDAKNNIYKGKSILNQARNLLSLIFQNPYFPDPRLDIFVSNKWDLRITLLSPSSMIQLYTTIRLLTDPPEAKILWI